MLGLIVPTPTTPDLLWLRSANYSQPSLIAGINHHSMAKVLKPAQKPSE